MNCTNMTNMFEGAFKFGDILTTDSASAYRIVSFIKTGKNGAVFKMIPCVTFLTMHSKSNITSRIRECVVLSESKHF